MLCSLCGLFVFVVASVVVFVPLHLCGFMGLPRRVSD